ncbi:Uncharacterized protein dnm_080320 [Desulfonema magnum]|uniref:Uncharacterized protein n=1 Tax=Desulfonema magnum TaxID=45655 RepID=A0A975BVG4_9BACT|nr:Uncharacterized protein dnm_080320 [Desulfonema magnum]
MRCKKKTFFIHVLFQSLSSPEGAGNHRTDPEGKPGIIGFNPFHLPKEQGTMVAVTTGMVT